MTAEPMNPENEAEEMVLEAFEVRAGNVDVGGEFLRAEFLRNLFLGRLGNGKDWEPRRVLIKNANIAGNLNLDYCDVLHPFCFFGCRFLNGVSLEASTVPTLELQGCRVSTGVKSKDKSGYFFVANDLRAMDVKLSDGFIAEGGVSLAGANIAGQLVCAGGKFEGELLAQDLTAGSVFFSEEFEAKDLVNLNGANIVNQLVCVGGTFMGCCGVQGREVCFLAQNLKSGNVFLGGKFKGKGQVLLSGSNVNDQLNCEGGEFEGDLLAEVLKAKNVLLRGNFKAGGDVKLLGANISGQLDCRDGTFGAGLDLTDATIGVLHSNEKSWPKKGFLHLDGFHYRRLKGGAGDSAKAGLKWLSRMEDGKFHPQPYEQLMSVYRRMGHTNWARKVGFALEERRHREYKKRGSAEDNERRWWDIWYEILRVTIGYGYKPFRSFGWILGLWLGGTLMFGGANLCGGGSLPPQSLEEAKALFLGSENRSKCSNRLILPVEGHALISRDGEVTEKRTPEHYPQFVPAVYALEALFPVLDFGQLEKWHPGSWLSGIRWGMTFLGTSLLAILALFGVGVLGPRWRSGKDGD